VTRDGSFIDYLQARSGVFVGPELWRVPFLGGTPKRLIAEVWTPVGWSPDGRHMAFVRVHARENSEDLVVADADGGRERVVTTRRRPKGFVSAFFSSSTTRPAWSPDGRVIAVFGFDGQPARPQVEFVDAATGVETVRAAQPGFVPQGLAWLGSAAVILSQPKEIRSQVQLWRMSYPDGALSPLTNDLNSYVGLDVSADLGSVVTSRSEIKIGLWVGDAIGSRGAEVVAPVPATTAVVAMVWAGERVVFDSTVNGRPGIVGVTPGTGGPMEITSQGGLPAATSDGKAILFIDTDGLWKLDAGYGARPVRLVSGDAIFPVVTPDNRAVVFLSQRSGVQSPWMVPIDGGEPAEVVRAFAGDGSLDVSPDSRRLLFGTTGANNEFTWAMCDLPRCAKRLNLSPPSSPVFAQPRFTADGRGLTYVDFTGSNLWLQPFDGGQPHQLTHFTDRQIRSFAYSHDGKRLAIARATTTNDIVLLKGLNK